MEVKELFEEYVQSKLISFDYKLLALSKEDIMNDNLDESVEYIVKDTIKFINRNDTDIIFSVQRMIKFMPLINLKITFEFTRELIDKDTEIDFNKWLKKLNPDELSMLGGNVFDKITLAISQVTYMSTGAPMTTAPVYYFGKDKE